MIKTDEQEFQAGERLYLGKTKIEDLALNEHMSRYEFAKDHIKRGDAVLDAACGTGYGTAMLAEVAGRAVGFEFSEHAVRWAKANHAAKNIEFVQGDLNARLPFADKTFDVVTSFETLEHIANQENMLGEFSRVLKSGGTLIISSPDREIITDQAHTENHFHINELSKPEFINILKRHFKVQDLYGQTKYKPLPAKKRMVKQLAKLDVFKLRRKIVRTLGLTNAVHKVLSPIEYSPIEKVSLEEKNQFYVLLGVGRKA